ncbi:MAG: LamG domain-containing protein, partial [Desulfobacterales bacterium]|nr:LamG domain-containing protein [Desulfobacterales bacterium]
MDGSISYAHGTEKMSFATDGSTGLVIDGNGSVGIGTTSPNQRLEVDGNLNVSGLIYGNGSQLTGINNGLWSDENGSIAYNGSVVVRGDLDLGDNESLYQDVYASDDGLVLYLPFSEPNGSVQYDRSPYGNDAYQKGNVECGSGKGKYGSGCEFIGGTIHDYILVVANHSNSTSVVNTTDFTISFWAYPNQFNGTQGLVTHDGGTGMGRTILSIRESCPNPGDFTTVFAGSVTCFGTQAKEKEWQLITLVVRENGYNDIIKLYVDGVKVGNTLYSNIDTNYEANWLLGTGLGRYEPFNGSIDEFKIYSRALSEEEIRTQYLRSSEQNSLGAITADKFRILNSSGDVGFVVDEESVWIDKDLNVSGSVDVGNSVLLRAPQTTDGSGGICYTTTGGYTSLTRCASSSLKYKNNIFNLEGGLG